MMRFISKIVIRKGLLPMFKEKVTVIGSGFVGSTIAYTLMCSNRFREIVIIDVNRDKAEGDAMDLNHGASFVAPVKVVAGDYDAAEGSDIVIITAGAAQKEGETRISLLQRNKAILQDIMGKLMPRCTDKTIILVVSNPVDILTFMAQKISGLDPKRIIGSGTVLDTSRLKYLLSVQTGVAPRNIHTYILGEHGDSEIAAFSITTVGGMSLSQFCDVCHKCSNAGGLCEEDIYQQVKNAAYEIIRKKGATYYAIALAVERIVETMIGDEHAILTVSSLIDGLYGVKDICISLPSIVGATGIQQVLPVDLSADEQERLRDSGLKMRSILSELGF